MNIDLIKAKAQLERLGYGDDVEDRDVQALISASLNRKSLTGQRIMDLVPYMTHDVERQFMDAVRSDDPDQNIASLWSKTFLEANDDMDELSDEAMFEAQDRIARKVNE